MYIFTKLSPKELTFKFEQRVRKEIPVFESYFPPQSFFYPLAYAQSSTFHRAE